MAMSVVGQLETFPALSRMSAAGGEADVFRQIADFGTRMSAVRGKADVPATWPGSPLLANKRHWRRNVTHRDAGDGTRPLHHKRNWQMDETSPYLFELSETQI